MVGAHGAFPGIGGGASKGYIVIAPRDTDRSGSTATLAIGPVTEHFVNQARNGGNSLAYGLGEGFEAVPAGYTIETVLTVSEASAAGSATSQPERVSVPTNGVNSALLSFGDFVLSRHGKQRARGDHNVETTYLGYSTTAFYFYNLCDCQGPPNYPVDPKTGAFTGVHNRERCDSVGGKSPIPAECKDRTPAHDP